MPRTGRISYLHSRIHEYLEEKMTALRALYAKLLFIDAGENFGGVVAGSRPARPNSVGNA